MAKTYDTVTTFRKQSISNEDEMHESSCCKGVQNAPGIDLNVTSPNQQQEGLQRVKNILGNPKSISYSNHSEWWQLHPVCIRKKCFVTPTTQIAYPVVQYQNPPTT